MVLRLQVFHLRMDMETVVDTEIDRLARNWRCHGSIGAAWLLGHTDVVPSPQLICDVLPQSRELRNDLALALRIFHLGILRDAKEWSWEVGSCSSHHRPKVEDAPLHRREVLRLEQVHRGKNIFFQNSKGAAGLDEGCDVFHLLERHPGCVDGRNDTWLDGVGHFAKDLSILQPGPEGRMAFTFPRNGLHPSCHFFLEVGTRNGLPTIRIRRPSSSFGCWRDFAFSRGFATGSFRGRSCSVFAARGHDIRAWLRQRGTNIAEDVRLL
eukprot:s872_g4.t1